jgi:hypothetical protein
MIAPIATAMSLLSRYSLALSLSSIDDPVRDNLNATVRHFSHLVALSTIAVALGVLMEGVELAHAVLEWRKRKRREKRERIQLEELRQVVPVSEGKRKLPKSHSEEPIWAKAILRVGLILVVIGVVGEWGCGAKLEEAHNAVHEYDLAKLTEADQKAGDAAKSARDLLGKYKAAEQEIIELKAAKLPRRLSSEQKELLRRRLTSLATKNIILSCVNGGTETFDFAQDFTDVFFHKPLAFGGQYPSSCSSIMGAVVLRVPPVQVEIGADRQHDADVLVHALAEIGIKNIATKPNGNKALLALTIGPKAE